MAGLSVVTGCGQGSDRAREDLLSGITPGKQLRLKKTGARTPYASKAKTSSACRFCDRCRGLELKFNSLSSKANTLPCRGGTIATIPRNPKPASSGPSGGLGGAQCSAAAIAAGLKERFAHVRNAETPATVSPFQPTDACVVELNQNSPQPSKHQPTAVKT